MENSKKLDQFYTKPLVCDLCINILINILKENNLNNLTFLEPSAGQGNFIDSLKNIKDKKTIKKILATDIDPKREDIIKLNYLNFKKCSLFNVEDKKIVVFGNPPFGKKSKLAINFVNKSLMFANIVAFIVPIQFEKWSVQSKIKKSARLIYSQKLEPKSFILNGKETSIRCCFQIWTKNNILNNIPNIRIINKPITKHQDFEMYQYNYTKEALKFFNKEKYNWDFAVPRQGYYDYNHKVFEENELNPKIQWIFFKANNFDVLNNLYNINYYKLSLNNTTIPGFGKNDVIEEYNKLYGGK